MAKPRIFVSSTYYDLKHIRKSIELFIEEIGYESVLFESGDIPFGHQEPLDESCYKELDTCHILVLIIGGRYGSESSDNKIILSDNELEKHYQHFDSITKKEYIKAKDKDMPIYIFIDKGVLAEFQTYKINKNNADIKYAHVDSVNIFRLIDSIFLQKRNNLVREFENVADITGWLKNQWAGLFRDFLQKKSTEITMESLNKNLSNLKIVTDSLKEYSESIVRGLDIDDVETIIKVIDDNAKRKLNLNIFLSDPLIEYFLEESENPIDKEKLYDSFVSSLNAQEFAFEIKELFGENSEIIDDIDIEEMLRDLRKELDLSKWDDSK